MFQHLLVPTDGTALSRGTALQAVRFDKSIDAKITAFHAMPELACDRHITRARSLRRFYGS